jgi:Tfp pilus assembly protein PilN
MEPLKLDYLTDGRSIWIGAVALVAGLFALLLVVWNYQEVNQKISQQEVLVANVRHANVAREAMTTTEKDSEQVALEIKQANSIILELSLPWKELFDAFESSLHSDIAVLAIEPDAQKGLVRISGEAKSLDSLPGYIAYLQKISLFKDVALLNHQIQEQDPQRPVRFMLQATWSLLQ